MKTDYGESNKIYLYDYKNKHWKLDKNLSWLKFVIWLEFKNVYSKYEKEKSNCNCGTR